MSIPSATYRLQFHKEFTFNQAASLADYLRELGVSHVYASPYFKASPGSTHGYDVADHNELNPEVGTREEYDAYVQALKQNGLGQIVDFVPNHMGIGSQNPYWMDVLENGRGSKYARYFDIDWHPLQEDLREKVLLPILGDQFGRVLEKGDLKLDFDQSAFYLLYFETRLPINPRSYAGVLKKAIELGGLPAEDEGANEMLSIVTACEHLPQRSQVSEEKVAERAREKEVIKKRIERLCQEHPPAAEAIRKAVELYNGTPGDPHSFDALDALIGEQAYRLAFWRVAAEEINYRRFFDINTLAALKMEIPEVFEGTHRLIFDLIKSGAVDGMRIDHVDGLWNPREYLEQLQRKYQETIGGDAGDQCGMYLLVEKILMAGEKLRPEWPVHGTTGYDFTNQVIEVLTDRAAEKSLTETYHRFIGSQTRFADIVCDKKKLTMQLALASEVHALAHILNRLAGKNRWYCDFTYSTLLAAIREVIATFPVYRTYAEPGRELSDDDKLVIDRAVRAARRRNPGMEASVFQFLRETLLLRFPENIDDAARAEHLRFVMKFQQCTGPITAKGIEDTAFYIYNRLVALNEVGGDPGQLGATPETFHKQNAARLADFPHAMLATSTHDTKRGEDVRARLAAISEIPETWRRAVQRFRTANRKYKHDVEGEFAPDANEEYLIYQTVAGAWPICPLDGVIDETFIKRIQEYMAKAIKEAKVNTSWVQPNENWDTAVREFVGKILESGRFVELMRPLAEELAQLGAINSLSQTLLKLTAPGVPDTYQGNEMWDLSLVDPDNRRPVDYQARRNALANLGNANPGELMENWKDGRIKLFLTQRVLRIRRENFDLFAKGDYTPVAAAGKFAESVFAFTRRHEGRQILVVAPRLSARVGFPPIGDRWGDTALDFKPEAPMKNLFACSEFSPRLADIFSGLPVALFVAP